MPAAAGPARAAVLDHVAGRICGLGRRRLRVAVDGPTAAGKSSLGHELVALVAATGRDVLRASLDDFERPWRERHRYDRVSGEGYYRNAFDNDAVRRLLLDPCWDLRIWLHVDAARSVARGTTRDADRLGSADEAERLHRERYLAAETVYVAERDPVSRADVVVDNADVERPVLLRG